MTKLSEARISHLAQTAMKRLRSSRLVEFTNEHLAYQEIKRLLATLFANGTDIDARVRQRILSLSRRIPENSREWEILYRKYTEEENRKRAPNPIKRQR